MTRLNSKTSPTASAIPLKGSTEGSAWRLEIPAGVRGQYRLAQLDDYSDLTRGDFPWNARLTLHLCARASAVSLPGTWGFGFWNDPFSLSLGIGGGVRRFPTLPNTAWFFHASAENHLSFQADKPAQGFLAQTFHTSTIPGAILALGSPLIPLLTWPQAARGIRSILGKLIKEDSKVIAVETTEWHTYCLHWTPSQVLFEVDGLVVFKTAVVPSGSLGLVIWIDNQYASFPPSGKLSYGTLENTAPAWIEVKDIGVYQV